MSDVEFEAPRLFDVRGSLYKREGRSPLNILLNVVIVFFCAILVIELSFNILYTGIYVIDKSMMPTLTGAPIANSSGGEFIYIDKYAKPDYGDIVVVYRETADGTKGNIIKRVVAFGGDTVRLDGGELSVKKAGSDSFSLVSEDYVVYNDTDRQCNNYAEFFGVDSMDNSHEHVVAEGCMYLLGDNRNESSDSRQNGDYPISSLVGVVPDWSMKLKSVTTKFYTFFNFTIWGK